ncbi:hypothetical protein LTR08_002236 [Meristemomyces frigidus]|nr:hypothetical protein LTR08_002236 [Meristemomyces frigidus]
MAKPTPEPPMASPSVTPEPSVEKKRKRTKPAAAPDDAELEIDITLPEPPSKKAKRAEKKKKTSQTPITTTTENPDGTTTTTTTIPQAPGEEDSKPKAPDQRSEYSIWIGNLPWTCTKDTLRSFLLDSGGIQESEVARLHMPAPVEKPAASHISFPVKPTNKGFAYVDFTTAAVLEKALALSETMMKGRRVLIKNAKSFAGRPEKPVGAGAELADGNVSVKPPAKRIWVGNLSFDVTKEDLATHFAQAGEVEEIFMATFEDSGKCKGFGWVTFAELESAEAAVRGFIYKKAEDNDDAGSDEGADSADDSDAAAEKKPKKGKKAKRNKYHINRLLGRELRREFAEDAQTRYKKRYGKGANADPVADRRNAPGDRREPSNNTSHSHSDRPDHRRDAGASKFEKRSDNKDERQAERRKRHERAGRVDARTVAPGMALASAKRASGAIVEGKGTKKTF